VIQLDWLEFFRTKNFGGIRLGMLGQDVKDLLGKQEDTSRSRHPQILKYGRLQIAFDENRVVSIGVYFRREKGPIWSRVKVHGKDLSSSISLEEFQELLSRNGIGSSIMSTWNFEDCVGLSLDSGVSAFFHREGSTSGLDGISLLDREYGASRAAERIAEIDQLADHLKDKLEKDAREDN